MHSNVEFDHFSHTIFFVSLKYPNKLLTRGETKKGVENWRWQRTRGDEVFGFTTKVNKQVA